MAKNYNNPTAKDGGGGNTRTLYSLDITPVVMTVADGAAARRCIHAAADLK